jgi:molybdate transport system ATP-binding protein
MLEIDVRKRLGAFALDARFESGGRLTALFGASGSGKSTLVNLVGGLLRPDQGRIEVDGRVLVDTDMRIHLPPHRRRVGYVFQDARLFPHMSVRANLGYGRFFTPKRERYETFDRIVELLGIGHLLDRRPGRLSGGEKQRVAIGRALIASPRLLLMDEPLAALDDARKAEIMPYLERLRDETEIPIIYVSHSVPEVARLANSVVVLSGGKVAASGPASEVLQRLDLLPREERAEGGALIDMTVAEKDGVFSMTVLRSAAGKIRVPELALPIGARIRVRLRARDIMIATQPPEGLSALNVLPGRITAIDEGKGALADVHLDCGGDRLLARITRQSMTRLRLAPGMDVFAVIKTVAFDAGAVSGAGGAREAIV